MTRILLILALALAGLGWLLFDALHGTSLPLWAIVGAVALVGALWAGAFGCGVMALAAVLSWAFLKLRGST